MGNVGELICLICDKPASQHTAEDSERCDQIYADAWNEVDKEDESTSKTLVPKLVPRDGNKDT